ncbi:Uncharacterized protein BM_BM11010 [Brugia malayi]|uniref:Bm11010 n=1 Tax=Brugia malayi TaxID=6279 RepID=A0A0K0IQB0_BRUMA|nr:Uncharacterized protein BM_BM11010 [Brugia malayi]CDQ00979.1 Bm11010 [Brugia malayi]VIO86701.1 Uncharacterized protein BM_BM11010 [Brugia malayi]
MAMQRWVRNQDEAAAQAPYEPTISGSINNQTCMSRWLSANDDNEKYGNLKGEEVKSSKEVVKVVARPYHANATTSVIITNVKRLDILQESLSKSKKTIAEVC